MHRPRRHFLKSLAGLTVAAAGGRLGMQTAPVKAQPGMNAEESTTLFLCGDVMTGRGIDQVLPQSVSPQLHEPYIRYATAYVNLAESRNGPIPAPVDYDYIWGDALDVLEQRAPDARIINLETAVTTNDEPWPGKSIHYRMHPENVRCLTAAGIDCCVLANNHLLDWGHRGLRETLATLQEAGIRTAGAGLQLQQATAPAIINISQGRILVFAVGHPGSGIPGDWRATAERGGINLLPELTGAAVENIADDIAAVRRPGDIVVVSIHWGGNWGYGIPLEQQRFARGLIDTAGVDIVHGHSSHHPRGIEIYKNRPILYGCGDFLNDYEGIEGHEAYRGELTLMVFPRLDRSTGRLLKLELVPMRIARFRLHHAAAEEARWLTGMLDREGAKLGTSARLSPAGTIDITSTAEPEREKT